MFKPNFKFNSCNKDVPIELYLSRLEEKLTKIEVPKEKFNNLTSSERNALYNHKDNKNIVNKGADKGSTVVVWDRKDYMKEAKNNYVFGEEISEDISNNPYLPLKTLNASIARIRK